MFASLIEKLTEKPIALGILVIPSVIKQLRIWHLGYLESKKDT